MMDDDDLTTSAGWPKRFRALLSHTGCFVLFWALVSGALSLIAPFPEVLPISEKLTYFQKHKDEYDAIFVGSSRVFRQIDPERFDRALATGGHPLRSFNFGQDAMWPPESLYVLRQILALPLPRLHWVFIEHMDLRTELKMMQFNGRTAQLAYWHDTRHTLLSYRDVWESSRPGGEKTAALLKHTQLWLTRTSHLGGGAEMMKHLLPPQPRPPNLDWQSHQGYTPLAPKRLSPAECARFQQELEHPSANTWERPTRPLQLAELEQIVALVRRAGAEPVFFSSPTIYKGENPTNVPAGASLFVFDRPSEYPQLLVPENFVNLGHLGQAGGSLYTDLFATKFLRFLESRSAPSARR